MFTHTTILVLMDPAWDFIIFVVFVPYGTEVILLFHKNILDLNFLIDLGAISKLFHEDFC